MEIRQAASASTHEREMMDMETSNSNLVATSSSTSVRPRSPTPLRPHLEPLPFLTSHSHSSSSSSSTSSNLNLNLNPFPPPSLTSTSLKSLPKHRTKLIGTRITLNPIRSALLLATTSLPNPPPPPRKLALYDEPPIPSTSTLSRQDEEGNKDEFVSNQGRSLRVRKGVRPSYLEIPPSVHSLIEPGEDAGGKGGEKTKVVNGKGKGSKGKEKDEGELGKVKVVRVERKRKRIDKREMGQGNSSLSELTSSEEEERKTSRPLKKKRKKKIKVYEPQEGYDRDSSPLSSIDSSSSSSSDDNNSNSSLSASSNSNSDSSESESDSPPHHDQRRFPHKPSSHPLNRIKIHPQPSVPPKLELFLGLNKWSWEESLEGLMLNGEIIRGTFVIDEKEIEGESEGEEKKIRPTWEWATVERDVPPAAISMNQATSIAHPPPPTPSKLSTLQLQPQPRSVLVPTTLNLVRPKTYRQLAKLDWEDFHSRNRCRFTTSGSIEGVNPEGLGWEDWFGVEDEGFMGLKREGTVRVSKGRRSKLVVLDREEGLRGLGGEGGEMEFERVRWEQSFESGMEWENRWRWKTLEEGKGNCWEERCRWAVRNPKRIWEDSMTRVNQEEEREMVMTRERERLRRKREKKKIKRERERREREGSGGESELTPFEGEELSADSSDEEQQQQQGGGVGGDSAETIAKRSSLILQEAAEAHAQSGKAGVMVKCPLVGCPQQFYRSKASSSVSTHERHYHTTHINLKYATGKSAYIQRDPKGDFTCPATGCGFVTKSRGTMAVHGKPGKCEGPAVSIPKPTRKKKGKRYKLPPPQTVVPSTTTTAANVPIPLPNYFGAAAKSSRFLSSEFVSSSEDEPEEGSQIDVDGEED